MTSQAEDRTGYGQIPEPGNDDPITHRRQANPADSELYGDPSGGIDAYGVPEGQKERNRLFEQQKLLMPWLPDELVEIYIEEYIEHGDPEIAWAAVRQAPAYEVYYPGNRREDGTLRLSEQAYTSTLEGYEDAFISIGMNPSVFRSHFVDLIKGDVSPDEFARERLEPIYDRVMAAAPAIQEYYANILDFDLTPEAIVASVLDPDIGQRIINRDISMAEIGGEAAERGFDIAIGMAAELFEQGIDRAGADRFFGEAASVVPTLSVLAQRHADPDDTFDLRDFTLSEVYSDPQQRRRIRRLVSQERSTFANLGAQTQFRRGQAGGVTGLTER